MANNTMQSAVDLAFEAVVKAVLVRNLQLDTSGTCNDIKSGHVSNHYTRRYATYRILVVTVQTGRRLPRLP